MTWDRTERSLQDLQRSIATVDTPEQCQVIGQLARDAIVSLAQADFVPATHWRESGPAPSPTDSKRMLDAYAAVALPGGPGEEMRSLARSTIKLADALAHKRTATPKDARLVALAADFLIKFVPEVEDHLLAGSMRDWSGLQVGNRFFAWDGPLLHALEDRSPIGTPLAAIEALGKVGRVSFGRRDRLQHPQAQDLFQVIETDRSTWRRELLNAADDSQVLLIRPSGAA